MAFSPNLSPTFPKQPQRSLGQITNGTSTNDVTAYTAGTNGSRIRSIIATSTDTSSRTVNIQIKNGGTDYAFGQYTIPISAGTVVGTPAVNLLDKTFMVGLPLDQYGNPYLNLISGDTLTVAPTAQITSGKFITVFVIADDF